MEDNRALLLTDLVDSTRRNEEVGDTAMSAWWQAHDRAARTLVARWNGTEVGRSDGFLLLFDSAHEATGFALAYHRSLAEIDPALKARVGIHVGPVTLRANGDDERRRGATPFEVDGIALPIAARVMSAASGGQTLLSGAARQALGEGASPRLRSHGHWRLKGLAAPIELFEIGEPSAPFAPPPDSAKAYRVVPDGDDDWKPVRALPHNLPAQRDGFVGQRDTLLALAERFDAGARLITLLGMGGIGKTRLALHYSRLWLGDYPGGAWFCDLAAARSVDGIVHAVGQGLDVPLGKADPVQQLAGAIDGRGECLVILDNFEQVSRLAGTTLGVWLDKAPNARFLVTSREVLGVPGEVSLSLPSLALAEAVELFELRARAIGGSILETHGERDALPRLVEMLDRLPLAIELAAARVRTMGPRGMLQRMGERFNLLASARGRQDRQATLRATLDWSWDLLDGAEQSAMAQLSVFEGGFTLAAAEAVVETPETPARWVVDLVQSLIEKSLVRVGERHRFELLRTVQEYADERLRLRGEERTLAQRRHWRHFARLPEAQIAADRCADTENCIAACRRAASSDTAAAVAALQTSWHGLRLSGPFRAALGLVDAFAALPDLAPAQRCVVDRIAGESLLLLGDTTQARRRLTAALAAAGEARSLPDEALVNCAMAQALMNEGQSAQAEALLVRALELAGSLGRDDLRLRGMNVMGALHLSRSRVDDALVVYEECLRLASALGDRRRVGGLHGNFGLIAQLNGRREAARDHYRSALALAQDVGDRQWEGNTRCNLGLLMLELGDGAGAEAQLKASLLIARSIGHRRLEAMALCNLGLVAERLQGPSDAVPLFADAVQVVRNGNDRRQLGQLLGYLGSAYARTDRRSDATAVFDEAERLLDGIDDPQVLAMLCCQRSSAASGAGLTAEAVRWLSRAEELLASSMPADGSELLAALTQARDAVTPR